MCKQFLVILPCFNPLFYFPVKLGQLGQNNRALQRVHATAYADSRVIVAFLLSMNANLAHRFGQFKNIGEFEMLRAARMMLLLAGAGVAPDRVMVVGEAGPAVDASKKARAPLPDRVDIELEPV